MQPVKHDSCINNHFTVEHGSRTRCTVASLVWLSPVMPAVTLHCRFRYQSLSELLETVYLMTGPSFLSNIQDSINTAQSWQQAEGAFFCLIAVAGPLKGHVTRTGSPYAQQTSELLLALFTDLCNPQARAAAFLSSPYTCATAAGLVGAYAPWFDVTAAAPLEGALRLLLHALCFPYSWHAAAGAFRALCMRCGSRLSNAPLLQGLASLAASAIAPASSAGEVGHELVAMSCRCCDLGRRSHWCGSPKHCIAW